MSKFTNVSMMDVTELIASLRDGEPPASILKQVLWIAGCVVEQLDGIPPVVGVRSGSESNAISDLEAVVFESKNVSSSDATGVPVWLTLLWPVLQMVLEQYIMTNIVACSGPPASA